MWSKAVHKQGIEQLKIGQMCFFLCGILTKILWILNLILLKFNNYFKYFIYVDRGLKGGVET